METEAAQGAVHEHHADEVSDHSLPDANGIQSSEAAIDAVDSLLDEVESALSRLDDGTYGMCESCGAPIDDAHLAQSPTTRSCSVCPTGPS